MRVPCRPQRSACKLVHYIKYTKIQHSYHPSSRLTSLSSFSSSFSSLPSSSPGASRNSQVPIYGTLRQLVGNRIRAGVSRRLGQGCLKCVDSERPSRRSKPGCHAVLVCRSVRPLDSSEEVSRNPHKSRRGLRRGLVQRLHNAGGRESLTSWQ